MNILFVSHASNRSGAPLVLLELLRYLQRSTNHEATLLSLRPGPLLKEFEQVAELFPLSKPFARASQLAAARRRLQSLDLEGVMRLDSILRALERLNLRRSRVISRRLVGRYHLVYLNSVASGDVLPALAPLLRGIPCITHVHELEWAIDGLENAFDQAKKRSQAFIAVSDAVSRHLTNSRGIAANKIETIYPFVDFSKLETSRPQARKALLTQLNLPASAFLIGGCGTMEWRKGADLWAMLAAQTARIMPEAEFVWLGGQDNSFSRQVQFDVKRLGLQKRVHFLPPTSSPAPFFAALDAFALTSREDPFPLVAIEAAAQGVPLLCFDQAGGIPELIGTDAGFVGPYGDITALTREAARWQSDDTARRQLGEVARVKARQMADVNVGAPQIVQLIERIAAR